MALRGKGETVDELVAFASDVQALQSAEYDPIVTGRLVDTCGTGGDSAKTFNVSTISAMVAAGAGVSIAKHGNRSVTSKCGSADLLESLGFNLGMEPGEGEGLDRAGRDRVHVRAHVPPGDEAGRSRKEGARHQDGLQPDGPAHEPGRCQRAASRSVLGIFDTKRWLRPSTSSASMEAMVVHGVEGMDEISVTGKTCVSWLKDGEVTTQEYLPAEMGVSAHPAESIARLLGRRERQAHP